MRTVLTLVLGFWIASQLYKNHHKKRLAAHNKEITQRSIAFLKEKGFTTEEIMEALKHIITTPKT